MEVEIEPKQPAEVERAVAELLGDADPRPDPWWQAGVEEALGT